jgi:hypothetical protein
MTPETAAVSSHPPASPQEESDAAVHVFETSIIFRTSSNPPPSPGASASPPTTVYSVHLAGMPSPTTQVKISGESLVNLI